MKKVYLEQSILGNLCDQNGRTPLFNAIQALQESRQIEVFASAQTAVELSIATDLTRRQQLSLVVEELTRGRRILPSYEFVIVRELLNTLKATWPTVTIDESIFKKNSADNQRIFSGLIAHMGALRDYDASGAHDDIIRSKLTSKLKHLDMMANPDALEAFRDDSDAAVRAYIEKLDGQYDPMSLQQLNEEITRLQDSLTGRERQAKRAHRLAADRDKLVSRYASSVVHGAFSAALSAWDETLLLDYSPIVASWNSRMPAESAINPLPPDLVDRAKAELTPEDMLAVSQRVRERYSRTGSIPQMMLDICLREIEKALKTNEAPTEGLTFDLDHAAMCYLVDVFLCCDSRLLSSLKIWEKSMKTEDGKQRFHAVGSIQELERLLQVA